MSLAPFAKVRLMPYNDDLPKRPATATLIIHTNGGGTDHGSLYGWFSRPGNTICSHFQVAADGRVEQYVNTDQQAYAQYAGNAFAVSVETEDAGHPERPWTDEQCTAIIKLARWLKVPAKISPDGKGGGIGWHSLYADWNRSHHNCPGSARIKQIHDVILPGLAGSTGPRHPPHHGHPSNGKPGDSEPRPYPGHLLRRTMGGPDVKRIQEQLHAHGARRLKADGDFGPRTERAVKRFQRMRGLFADGVVGPRTWKALFG